MVNGSLLVIAAQVVESEGQHSVVQGVHPFMLVATFQQLSLNALKLMEGVTCVV